MTARHSTRGHACLKVTTYDSGTQRLMVYQTKVLDKGKLQPVASTAVGALVAVAITFVLFGTIAQPPAEPVLTVITPVAAIDPPVADVPPMLAPALPAALPPVRRHRVTVSRLLPTRLYPAVKQSVVDLPKGGKHRRDKARKGN